MGYRGGGSNYEERDKLFQTSINDKPVDKTQVKKGLADLFKSKSLPDPCLQGHAWIRDWDGKNKCSRCKVLKPVTGSFGH